MPPLLPLPIIPVLDLKQGNIVRAIAGERASYAPIATPICAGSAPKEIASALLRFATEGQLYLADLDAIAGQAPDWNSLREVLEVLQPSGKLLLDLGIRTAEQLSEFNEQLGSDAVFVDWILASETFSEQGSLRKLANSFPDRLYFSLDLRKGVPMTACDSWSGITPIELVAQVLASGIQNVLVLELSDVGRNQGPTTLSLLAEIKKRFPASTLLSGGGVRGEKDLEALLQCGCDGALVASWLHDKHRRP